MTKPPRKKPAKTGAKRVAPVVRHSCPGAHAGELDQVTALFERIVGILEQAQARVVRAVNSEMVLADWQIGREIVEHLQGGEDRAGYGEKLIEELSGRLGGRFGRGLFHDESSLLPHVPPRVPDPQAGDSPHPRWRMARGAPARWSDRPGRHSPHPRWRIGGPQARDPGLDQPLRVLGLHEGHRTYLTWHRERVFKRGTS